MKCCHTCFSSKYLQEIITSNSIEQGKCNFCLTENANLYNPKALIDFFHNLLSIYSPIVNKEYDPSFAIENKLLSDFQNKIFAINEPTVVRSLLLAIIEEEIENFNELFENPVHIECLTNQSNIEQTNLLELSWDKFVEEIKRENRFHIRNAEYLTKLENLFKRHEKQLFQDKFFYRGRISNDEHGFGINEMGVPPYPLSKAGRANPQGISYLYVTSDIDTAIYEIRATIFDYISIGKFKVIQPLNIINLREVDIYDPIELAEQDTLEDFLIHLPFISRLEKELSKPHRRSDDDLDYLPTQYLCEFIKSKGYDGLEYKSSVNPSQGANLAIFYPNKLECIDVKVYEIQNITFEKIIRLQPPPS